MKFLLLYLAFFSSSAWAQKVTKQNNCLVLIEGLSAPKVGDKLTVTQAGKSYTVQLKIANPNSSQGEVLTKSGSRCAPLVGATVQTSGKGQGVSSNVAEGAGKNFLFGALRAGWTLNYEFKSSVVEEGATADPVTAGPEVVGLLGYNLGVNQTVNIPVMGGFGFQQVTGITDAGGFNINSTFLFVPMVLGVGAQFTFDKIEIAVKNFVDVGLFYSYTVNLEYADGDVDVEYGFARLPIRNVIIFEGGYSLTPALSMGLHVGYGFGNFLVKPDPEAADQSNISVSFSGLHLGLGTTFRF